MSSMQADAEPLSFPNRATPVGSARYYAVRFAKPRKRAALALLLLWYDEIRRIAAAPRDPGVARLKLDWWGDELQRLRQQQARHPVSRALQQLSGLDAACVTQMMTVIEATENEIVAPALGSDSAFFTACRHTGGSLYRLLATVECPSDPANAAVEQGCYGEAVERIRLFRDCPHRLPADVARIHAAGHQEHAALSSRCDGLLGALAAALPDPARPTACNITRRLYTLQRAMHVKMQRQAFPVDRQLVERPPIADLWTAWRCR
jgi:phytoene synthase